MLKSTLCDYSHAYILVTEIITVPNIGATANPHNSYIIASFTDSISEINNTQIDNAKDIDVAMIKYNFIEYSDNY